MNEAIVQRHNELVKPSDLVYVLGDLMLGTDYEAGMKLIKSMNGTKMVIAGNHDTKRRREIYALNDLTVLDAFSFKYNGYNFYASHYPTLTSNLEKETLKQCVINLYGHTHQTDKFYQDIPYMFHCGVDAHDCKPVNLDDVIIMMKEKVRECKKYL